MPLRHSPHKTLEVPAPAPKSNSPLSGDFDTASDRSVASNVTSRQKCKRELDDNWEMIDFRAEVRSLIATLSNSVIQQFNEFKQQNSEMQKSLQFMSDKYDDVMEKINALEIERGKAGERIDFLETRVETLERKLTKKRNIMDHVVVELTSVTKKESILQVVRMFNKVKNAEGKLNTKHLILDGASRPICLRSPDSESTEIVLPSP
ncbi:hypothetical protein ACJJTC_009328 [Scirpophaga incertulas]